MKLSFPELYAFLEFEGFTPGEDAKNAVQMLLKLRQMQLSRLAGYVTARSPGPDAASTDDQEFSLALMEIPVRPVMTHIT